MDHCPNALPGPPRLPLDPPKALPKLSQGLPGSPLTLPKLSQGLPKVSQGLPEPLLRFGSVLGWVRALKYRAWQQKQAFCNSSADPADQVSGAAARDFPSTRRGSG